MNRLDKRVHSFGNGPVSKQSKKRVAANTMDGVEV